MHKKNSTWTKEDLIEAIQRVRREKGLNRMPTMMEMRRADVWANTAVQTIGITWTELATELRLPMKDRSSIRDVLTKEKLQDMYVEKEMSLFAIAKELGVSPTSVKKYLITYGFVSEQVPPTKEYLTIEDMKRRLRLKEGKEIRTKRGVLKIMSVYGCFISVIDKKGIRGSIHVQDLYAAMKKRGEKK